jgi:hypothetical protein
MATPSPSCSLEPLLRQPRLPRPARTPRARPWACVAAALLTFAAGAGGLAAQQAPPRFLSQAVNEKASLPASGELARALDGLAPLQLLPAHQGAADKLAVMAAHNSAHVRPIQIGFTRPLPAPLAFAANPGAPATATAAAAGKVARRGATDTTLWGAKVQVPLAYRLRLHLEKVKLPAGARLWVGNMGGLVRTLDSSLLGPAGDLWTPSVQGDTIALGVELPAAAADGNAAVSALLSVTEVAQIFAADSPEVTGILVGKATGCDLDATCIDASQAPPITSLRAAVAELQFTDGQNYYACTGSLLNTTDASSVVPYLMTAHHCISTAIEAGSLEAWWDYKTAACNGAAPNLDTLPTSLGAQIMATSAQSDFCLLRLNGIPAGRVLLGWQAAALANGSTLYRVSHPVDSSGQNIQPQVYSTSTADLGTPDVCADDPGSGTPVSNETDFIYSLGARGGIGEGSSGSPIVLANGDFVGQLLGLCGTPFGNGCADASSHQIDGAFAVTYQSVSQFLNPGPKAPAGSCAASAQTLCIDDQAGDHRFAVEVTVDTAAAGGVHAPATAIPLASLGVDQGGIFWFFGSANPELLVKVLNGCSIDQRYWVFYSANTNVGFTVVVTDTLSGRTKTYSNADQTLAMPQQDTSAFPCS